MCVSVATAVSATRAVDPDPGFLVGSSFLKGCGQDPVFFNMTDPAPKLFMLNE